MKTSIKLTALAAALACGAIVTQSGRAQSQAPAPNAVVSEQRQVGAFSAIELNGPYRVVIDAQGKPALSLAGERKEIDEVVTEVRGDTLVVRPRDNRPHVYFSFGKRHHEPVTVRISAASLKSLRMNGSGDVDLSRLAGEAFTLANSGPGDLHASGALRQLTVTSSGAGDLDLRQLQTGDLRLTMNGPGDVQLGEVKGALSAQTDGAGDLSIDGVHASKVEVWQRGPGDVRLTGSSRELRLESSGAGDFEGCGLAVEAARSVQRGPGNACIAGTLRSFDAEIDGSGDLSARGLQASAARLQMRGPGNAELAGTVGDFNLELSGSGDLDARSLQTRSAIVRSRGPGEVRLASVSDTLDAELHSAGGLSAKLAGKRLLLTLDGPGDARIDGAVAQAQVRVNGSGSLDGRSLNAGRADVQVHGPGNAAVNVADQALLVDRDGSRRGR